MQRLFTYTIPYDDGAAPNPFFGMCTLTICKPSIRRVAQVGDWIAGLGSKNAPSGDLSGCLVYAMRVDDVLSMNEYDEQALDKWPHRIPKLQSMSLQDRLGDCIYDYSSGEPVQRRGVHGSTNVDKDLSGKNALISKHFFYFGAKAIPLPDDLRKNLCHQTQGHKSNSNAPSFNRFIEWLDTLALEPGQIYGWPDYVLDWKNIGSCGGCLIRSLDDENDFNC
ncbi:hypothetical protein AAKU64_004224 [Undibacterium sp. GrIS 1.8]|uniref:Nmad2 family putative nucleotide modification protein n=1 Tax=Undibacterium sp. GrIS 1.8 TaxID=3143934 RepID=UPI003396EBCA